MTLGATRGIIDNSPVVSTSTQTTQTTQPLLERLADYFVAAITSGEIIANTLFSEPLQESFSSWEKNGEIISKTLFCEQIQESFSNWEKADVAIIYSFCRDFFELPVVLGPTQDLEVHAFLERLCRFDLNADESIFADCYSSTVNRVSRTALRAIAQIKKKGRATGLWRGASFPSLSMPFSASIVRGDIVAQNVAQAVFAGVRHLGARVYTVALPQPQSVQMMILDKGSYRTQVPLSEEEEFARRFPEIQNYLPVLLKEQMCEIYSIADSNASAFDDDCVIKAARCMVRENRQALFEFFRNNLDCEKCLDVITEIWRAFQSDETKWIRSINSILNEKMSRRDLERLLFFSTLVDSDTQSLLNLFKMFRDYDDDDDLYD